MEDTSSKGLEISWFCTYTPVELLEAAGLAHRRLAGLPERAEEADSYLHPSICPYVKACLAEGLRLPEGRRNAVFVNACDAMRRLYDAWSELFPGSFVHLVDLPRGNSPREVDLLAGELRHLAGRIGEYFGRQVTGEALLEATQAREEKRATYLQRAATLPPGERAALSLELQSSLRELPALDGHASPSRGIPVAVVGNVLNPRGILDQLERAGARVVLLDTCNGDRPFLVPLEIGTVEGDPFRRLAAGYLGRSHCARMQDAEGRWAFLLERLDESGAAGVIFAALKFCDPYIYEYPLLERSLEERGIKVLRLESDYLDAHAGQVSTRVEAFLEMISVGRGR